MARAKSLFPLTLAAAAVIACALTCALAGDGPPRGNPGLSLSTPPDDSVDINSSPPVTVQGGAFFSASTGTPPQGAQDGNPPPPAGPASGQPQWQQGGRGMGGNSNTGPANGPPGPGGPNMGPGGPGVPPNAVPPPWMNGQGCCPGGAGPWMMGQSPEMMHLAQIRAFNDIAFNPREAGFMAIVMLKENLPPDEQVKALEGYLASVKSPGLRNGIRIALIDLYKGKGDKDAVRKQAEAMLMDNDAALQAQEAARHEAAPSPPKTSGGK